MQTIIMPKSPQTYDYFVASLVYIAASCTNNDGIIEIETEEKNPNTRSEEVKSFIRETFPDQASQIVDLHVRYNVCEPIICGSGTVIEKIEKIAASLITHFDLKTSLDVI